MYRNIHEYTYNHFEFLASLEAPLGVDHSCVRMNFEFSFTLSALDAVLNLAISPDILVVSQHLNPDS